MPNKTTSIQLSIQDHHTSMGVDYRLYMIQDGKTLFIGSVLDNVEEFKSTLMHQINPKLKGLMKQ